MLKPRLEQYRAGDGAALADPKSGQAQGGHGHGLHVTGLLGQPVGPLVARPARQQIAVLVLGAGPVRERGRKLLRLIGDQFQAARRHDPVCLARHRLNLFAAAAHRRDRKRAGCAP
jgi:hypothetical protein